MSCSAITYGIGRRTGMNDPGGSEAWSYDKMGRVGVACRRPGLAEVRV
ncbi:MAG: hypothetical protein LAN18_11215 [Acidobacteriia bacterium]|nr:hypothetical protein [Terriglobia bacterium]